MGDSCCDEHLGIGEVKALLEQELAVPVYSVALLSLPPPPGA